MSPTVNPNKSRWILLFIIFNSFSCFIFLAYLFFRASLKLKNSRTMQRIDPVYTLNFDGSSLIHSLHEKLCEWRKKCDSIWDLSTNAPIFNNFFSSSLKQIEIFIMSINHVDSDAAREQFIKWIQFVRQSRNYIYHVWDQ